LACFVTIAMPDQPDMSPASKELFKKLRMIVPPMLEKFHKGAFLPSPHCFKAIARSKQTL